MVRVGVWGDLGVEDAGRMLVPRIVRRELEARLPEVTVRAWSSGDLARPNRFSDPDVGPVAGLGPWSTSRADELAAAIDILVIDGDRLVDTFMVAGVGPVNEPDIPTSWHAVRLDVEPDAALADQLREALARRAYVSARDARTAERLAALVDREIVVVPGHALLAERLFRPDEPEERVARLRSAGLLPEGDVLVVHGGPVLLDQVDTVAGQVDDLCRDRGFVPVLVSAAPGDAGFLEALADRLPVAYRLSDALGLEDICAVIGWSGGFVGGSVDLALVAAGFGRPSLFVAPDGASTAEPGFPPEAAASAIAASFVPVETAAIEGMRAVLDAHFDHIAALAWRAEPVSAEERRVRSLAARLAALEATSAAREHELDAVITGLTRRITESGTRFVSLWRKIHDCDRQYAWQLERAETAEAQVERQQDQIGGLQGEIASLHEETAWLRGSIETLEAELAMARVYQQSRVCRGYIGARRRLARLLRRLHLLRRPAS